MTHATSRRADSPCAHHTCLPSSVLVSTVESLVPALAKRDSAAWSAVRTLEQATPYTTQKEVATGTTRYSDRTRRRARDSPGKRVARVCCGRLMQSCTQSAACQHTSYEHPTLCNSNEAQHLE